MLGHWFSLIYQARLKSLRMWLNNRSIRQKVQVIPISRTWWNFTDPSTLRWVVGNDSNVGDDWVIHDVWLSCRWWNLKRARKWKFMEVPHFDSKDLLNFDQGANQVQHKQRSQVSSCCSGNWHWTSACDEGAMEVCQVSSVNGVVFNMFQHFMLFGSALGRIR